MKRTTDPGIAGGGPYRQAIEAARDRLGRLASAVYFYLTIGSTNDAAASLAAIRSAIDVLAIPDVAPDPIVVSSDPEGIVVIANEQTAGRGRRGHTWFSAPGSGLYVSVVLMPLRATVDPPRAIRLLTLAAGVALSEGINLATGLEVDLKWPNDLYIGRRKLAGILAEGAVSGSIVDPIVLGYGINVGRAAYPADLADRATSLEQELGRGVERETLLVETLASLSRWYDDLLAGRFDDILDAWRRRAPSAFGARVKWPVPFGDQSGITTGIDDQGALLVRTADRTEAIVAGELQWEF
jgi:BirA family transcriptional regulator, biotin operon repressor / biotin---[acetyl-CoA-carboxylase] ligase